MLITKRAVDVPHCMLQDLSWNAGKKFMGNVDGFLKSLQSFDKDNIPMICVDKVSRCTETQACCLLHYIYGIDVKKASPLLRRLQVEKDYISNAGFTPANIKSKSGAAAGLCSWVINICKYFRIYQVNLPLLV